MTFHPQSEFKYFTKIEVEAAQWTGDNLDEMKRLLAPYAPEVYAEKIEDFFNRGRSYFMLKFYVRDDMEVDPGQWVVVYSDGEIEIMANDDFVKMGYRK